MFLNVICRFCVHSVEEILVRHPEVDSRFVDLGLFFVVFTLLWYGDLMHLIVLLIFSTAYVFLK